MLRVLAARPACDHPELPVSTLEATTIDSAARLRLKRHFWAGHWTFYPEAMMMAGVVAPIVGLFFLRHALWMTLLGILVGGAGWGWFKWRKFFVGSQVEFDRIAEADYLGVQALALQRFELTADDLRFPDPCKFRSAVTKRDIGHAFQGLRVGSDEKGRRSPHEYLVINFGHHQLFLFRCVWDLTSGSTVYEETHEFAFRDIVCVELTHKKETIRINLNTRPLIAAWEKNGIRPVNGWLQVPTDESVSLRLVHGEVLELFSWKRSSAGVPSGEGKTCFLTAQRLQKQVRELKRPRHHASVAPKRPATPAT